MEPYVLPGAPFFYLNEISAPFKFPFRDLSKVYPSSATLIIEIPPLSPGGFECEIPVKFHTFSLNEYVKNDGFITIPVTLLTAAAWNTLSPEAFAQLYKETLYPVFSAHADALSSFLPSPLRSFLEGRQDEDDEQKQPNPLPPSSLSLDVPPVGSADLD
jgi:hypothetical protein